MNLNDIISVSVIVVFSYQLVNLSIDILIARCQNCNMRQKTICRTINIAYYQLIAWWQKKEVVCMLDRNDKVRITVVDLDLTDGETRYGYSYHWSGVGNLIFNADGSVENASGAPTSIKCWLPLNTEKRIWMVLQGATNFGF